VGLDWIGVGGAGAGSGGFFDGERDVVGMRWVGGGGGGGWIGDWEGSCLLYIASDGLEALLTGMRRSLCKQVARPWTSFDFHCGPVGVQQCRIHWSILSIPRGCKAAIEGSIFHRSPPPITDRPFSITSPPQCPCPLPLPLPCQFPW